MVAGAPGSGGRATGGAPGHPDPCEPNPCAHGGSCKADGDGVACACGPGASGEHCEKLEVQPVGMPPLEDCWGTLGFNPAALSGDGRVVVGYCDFPGNAVESNTFRWTPETGSVLVVAQGVPNGINDDGSVIVGRSTARNEGFRWTAATGRMSLGDATIGDDTSADGTVVVGGGALGAFRWTPEGGVELLGGLPGFEQSVASAVSRDGSVVAGTSSNGFEAARAFRWTREAGIVDLGELPGTSASVVWGMSADGGTIVGRTSIFAGGRAFRWTEDGGMVDLGVLPGGTGATAVAASADGSVIVGQADVARGTEGFIWNEADGIRSATDVLTAAGADIHGWELGSMLFGGIVAVSDDGKVVLGYGRAPEGGSAPWIARLP